MDDEQLHQRVREMREAGRTPKQIARALDVRLPVVARAVRVVAQQNAAAAPRPPVIGCWVNPGWDEGLGVDHGPDWPRGKKADGAFGGLATVVLARRHRWDKAVVTTFLVDVYCLGVKNTVGPDVVDEVELSGTVRSLFRSYDAAGVPAPYDLAQHLVLGAVEYARGLGFEPHPDFEQTRGELEPWDGPSAITFGCDGRPTYMEGPYDNARQVMRTLDASVGSGNYGFTVNAGNLW